VEGSTQGVEEDPPQNTVISSLHSYLTWDDYSAYEHSEGDALWDSGEQPQD
jgi:hypothetical protein